MIQSNLEKLFVKANLVPLGVAMQGCQLYAAVPEKPGWEPEVIAQNIKASMKEMQTRAFEPTLRDVFEIVKQNEVEHANRTKCADITGETLPAPANNRRRA